MSLGFSRVVKAPYSQYVGKRFDVLGNWWGSCEDGDEIKVFKMMVTDFDPARLGTAGKGKAMKVVSWQGRRAGGKGGAVCFVQCVKQGQVPPVSTGGL